MTQQPLQPETAAQVPSTRTLQRRLMRILGRSLAVLGFGAGATTVVGFILYPEVARELLGVETDRLVARGLALNHWNPYALGGGTTGAGGGASPLVQPFSDPPPGKDRAVPQDDVPTAPPGQEAAATTTQIAAIGEPPAPALFTKDMQLFKGLGAVESYLEALGPVPGRRPYSGSGAVWSAAQEREWKEKIAEGNYPWQQLKVIREVLENDIAESRVILWEGLNSSSLWVRMEALFGLEKFREEIAFTEIKRAVGEAGEGELARFLRRYEERNEPWIRRALRKILPFAGPETRATIVRALKQGSSAIDGDDHVRVLEAARHDPSPEVHRVAAPGKSP